MKEYKYICKLCKKHPTSEGNQLCSECRNKKMGDTQRCIIVGICIPLHRMAFATNVVEHTLWILLTLLHFEGNIREAWACMDGLAGVGRWPVL